MKNLSIFNLCLLLGLFFVVFSCSDDENQVSEPIEFEDHFPVEEYRSNSSIVYKNAQGREVTYSISLWEGSTDTLLPISESICVFNELSSDPNPFPVIPLILPSVFGDFSVINLQDESDPAYTACFRLNAFPEDFTEEEEDEFLFLETLSVYVSSRDFPGPTGEGTELDPFFTFFQTVFRFIDKPEGQMVSLLDQNFEDVFEATWTANDGFTKIYINEEIGMVGYLDEVGDLYVFDRYE